MAPAPPLGPDSYEESLSQQLVWLFESDSPPSPQPPSNAEHYLNFLENKLYEKLDETILLRQRMWYQHDGAPAHFGRQESNSGQASGSTRKWKYEDEMSSHLPHFKERPTICTVPATQEDKDIDDEETGSDEDNEGGTASPEVNISQKTPLCEATMAQPSTFKKKHAISESSQNSDTPLLKRAIIRRTTTLQSTTSEMA
ncbi:hypothetical protein CBL_08608 [Carabus blaptoides fortunei]